MMKERIQNVANYGSLLIGMGGVTLIAVFATWVMNPSMAVDSRTWITAGVVLTIAGALMHLAAALLHLQAIKHGEGNVDGKK